MTQTKPEKLSSLCKEKFLKDLYNYFSFQFKDNYCTNQVISKSLNFDDNTDNQMFYVQRNSHLGLREQNLDTKISNSIIDESNLKEDSIENDKKVGKGNIKMTIDEKNEKEGNDSDNINDY